jgi:hypothetical protein
MINLDIARQQLHNQLITRSTFEKSEDGVQWLGAIQAQDWQLQNGRSVCACKTRPMRIL